MKLLGSPTKIVNTLLDNSISEGVSDIHLEPFESLVRVRTRVDGTLIDKYTIEKRQQDEVISRLKILAKMDISEKRRPQDGRILVNHETHNVDIRMSTLPTEYGEKIVLRILDKSKLALEYNSIGLNKYEVALLESALNSHYGMFIVTGPTGSGKTTTLYTVLSKLNTDQVNIMTIEDPVEYKIHGINQSQVRPDLGFTYNNALKTFLRQDPDIIMVGEMRDSETVDIAMRSALTGHLVLSTLHTNDASSTVTRLLDMGVEPFLLVSSVKIIIAQRLVRLNCTSCSTELEVNYEFDLDGEKVILEKVKEGNGCSKCNNTGFKGRKAIFEILILNDEINSLILSHSDAVKLKKAAIKGGMITLKKAAFKLLKDGLISYDEYAKYD